MLTGTTGRPASMRDQEGAALEARHAPSVLRVPSGKTISECRCRTSRAIFFRMPAPGLRAIDQQVAGPLQVPAEERESGRATSFAMIRSWNGSDANRIGMS